MQRPGGGARSVAKVRVPGIVFERLREGITKDIEEQSKEFGFQFT